MKTLLVILMLGGGLNAYAAGITNVSSNYYHVCTTSDGGYTWKDEGTVDPNTSSSFDSTADGVAVGRIGDCNYYGNSWTNHAADYNVFNWSNIDDPDIDGIPWDFNSNAAMIFWQENAFEHVSNNIGLDSVCLYGGFVRPGANAGCWF